MAKKGMLQKAKKPKKEKVQIRDEDLVQEEMQMSYEDENDHRKSNDNRHRVTLEEIDAMSDGEDDEIEEWNAEAKALRQAIAEGAFDKISLNKVTDDYEDDEESIESDDASRGLKDEEDSEEDDSEEQKGEEEQSDSEQDQDETDAKAAKLTVATNLKALTTVTSQLLAEKEALPWPEKFDIVSENPLPFGQVTEEGLTIEVHDDLKREVAFYNLALEAVHTARRQCDKYGIPFTRPDDFFAEMVKTDDHMAKVKDRLIFESKKMEAFEQRKSNREQKLRAKEKHAHRIAEKAKAKRQHLRDVEEWANAAKSNRVGGGKVRDDDDEYLARIGAGPNKKRLAANKKYGYGGKRGRFKQTDSKTLNDMSAYNPKGNFAGGKKSTGNKRKGKRARDAAKAKR